MLRAGFAFAVAAAFGLGSASPAHADEYVPHARGTRSGSAEPLGDGLENPFVIVMVLGSVLGLVAARVAGGPFLGRRPRRGPVARPRELRW
jgi:hypothetical protein